LHPGKKTAKQKIGAGILETDTPEHAGIFSDNTSGCKHVFYRRDKNGYHGLGDFKNAWRRCLKIAGVNNFRFHDTRHCSASALIDTGRLNR